MVYGKFSFFLGFWQFFHVHGKRDDRTEPFKYHVHSISIYRVVGWNFWTFLRVPTKKCQQKKNVIVEPVDSSLQAETKIVKSVTF